AAERAAAARGARARAPGPVREVAEDGGGRQPLAHLADLGHCLVRRSAARDQLAGPAVAAVAGEAGDDQVAHAGEAAEGLRRGALGLAPPRPLDEPPRDQARLPVVAQPEARDAPPPPRPHLLPRGAALAPREAPGA